MKSINGEASNEEINELISQKQSFRVTGIGGRVSETAVRIERLIELKGLSCRLYTAGRLAAAGVGVFEVGAGLIALAGIAAHNLVTLNPDYEIAKHLVDNALTVTFQG